MRLSTPADKIVWRQGCLETRLSADKVICRQGYLQTRLSTLVVFFVGCIQHSLLHLTPPNTYVVKAQPHCPPSPKNVVLMHVVFNIQPGVTSNTAN